MCYDLLQDSHADDLVRAGRDGDDIFGGRGGVAVSRFVEFDGLHGGRFLPEADAFGQCLARGIPEAENLAFAVFGGLESGEDELVVEHFHEGLLRGEFAREARISGFRLAGEADGQRRMERQHFACEIRGGQFARVGAEVVAECQIRKLEAVLFAGRVDRAAVGAEERRLDRAQFVVHDTAFVHAAGGNEREALLAVADRLDVEERLFGQFHFGPVAGFGIDGDGAFREVERMMGEPCLRVLRAGRAEDAEAMVFDRVVDGRLDFDGLRVVAQRHKRHDKKVFARIRTMLRMPVVAFREVHLGLDAEGDALRAVVDDGNLAGGACR